MDQRNIGAKHIPSADQQTIINVMEQIVQIMEPLTPVFNEKERLRYGSINEQNKLFVNKILDYYNARPQLSTSDIDWREFKADYNDRKFADKALKLVNSIQKLLTDFKIAHDYDNFQDALLDYDYTDHKTRANIAGYLEKQKELKQFFPRTSKTQEEKEDEQDLNSNTNE